MDARAKPLRGAKQRRLHAITPEESRSDCSQALPSGTRDPGGYDYQCQRMVGLYAEMRHLGPRGPAWPSQAHALYREILDAAHRDLAQDLGLILAKTSFDLEQLLRGRGHPLRPPRSFKPEIDHAVWLRERIRPHRPAAIVTHTYVSFDGLDLWADEVGVRVLRLPDSVYFPGGTHAAVLLPSRGAET